LHQIALGLHAYGDENDGAYPYGLAWPAAPFSPPPFGPWNPQVRFTVQDSGQWFAGYPAYIALYKYGQIKDERVFFCPAQELLKPGGEYTWSFEPPSLQEALSTGESAYRRHAIGYSWYADSWMSKDVCDPSTVANFPGFMWGGYPDNWWAHPLGRSNGACGQPKKRQVIADRADDRPETMIAADIMSDYRGFEDVLPEETSLDSRWGHKPDLAFNSHGGPYRFVGGNVARNDGSVKWRERANCESDFKRSFLANQADDPYFEHMAVIHGSESPLPGTKTVYNLYW
jgi:hypothetical protein